MYIKESRVFSSGRRGRWGSLEEQMVASREDRASSKSGTAASHKALLVDLTSSHSGCNQNSESNS